MAFYSFDRRIINPSIKPWGTRDFAPFWTPARITTALWLDAADSDTVTLVGSGVSEWQDKSGNNRHATQGTSSRRPTKNTAGLNQKDTVTFGGNADVCLDSSLTHSQPKTYYVVAKTNITTGSSGSRQYVFDGAVSGQGAGRNLLALRGSQTNKPSLYALTWGAHSESVTPEFAIYSATFNGTSSVVGINATNNIVDGGIGVQSFGLVIGRNHISATTSDALNGDIAEIVVVDALSQKLEGYLAHKYGLSGNLPSDHPYKTRAPRA